MNYPLTVPLIVVHNYLENFREFLLKVGDREVLMARRFNGDQALFWCQPEKLVISSAPIENGDLFRQRWDLQKTVLEYPDEPSAELSLDIVNSPRLRATIVDYAGVGKEIAIVSYAATPELYKLANVLEKEEGLTVHLPEAPLKQNLWIKRYVDTKLGFRSLIVDWLSDYCPLPQGFVTDDGAMVKEMIGWYASREKGCVVKADQGGSGVGNLFLPNERLAGVDDFGALLAENEFLQDGVFVVEELIGNSDRISPSIEFYVPPIGAGEPIITYVCTQHFEASGRFAGIVVGKELNEANWAENFGEVGLKVAIQLQEMGYIGTFDIDAVLDDDENLYLVEINSRRTGGTYAHEFLVNTFGEDYADQFTIISQNKLNTRYTTLADLETALGDLMYPMNGEKRGAIILTTSALTKGNFGFLMLGESIVDVVELRDQLVKRVS